MVLNITTDLWMSGYERDCLENLKSAILLHQQE